MHNFFVFNKMLLFRTLYADYSLYLCDSVAKIGGVSEKLKYIWFFARLALSLQPNYKIGICKSLEILQLLLTSIMERRRL